MTRRDPRKRPTPLQKTVGQSARWRGGHRGLQAPDKADNESERPGQLLHPQEVQTRAAKAGEAEAPNVLDREFDGCPPHTHIVGDPTYVRIGGKRNFVCLLADLHNREIVGHAASGRKDARLVKAAFAALGFPPMDIDVFHADRGSEFANPDIDDLLEAFGIRRSLSRKGNPCDNAVIEPPTGS